MNYIKENTVTGINAVSINNFDIPIKNIYVDAYNGSVVI